MKIIKDEEYEGADGRIHVDRWGLCDCGREVELGHFTCPCDCGRDYNWAGQLLAPRSQWGYETGESLSDILSVDSEGYNPYEDTDWDY